MGNFSRDTFDKLKHYVSVRLQQGVPLVDADWNEQDDIRRYELQAFLKWFIGNGVPEGNDGFNILPLPVTDNTPNDFIIKGGDGTAQGAGRCLAEGWDVINESDLKYKDQPLLKNNGALATKWKVAPLPLLNMPTTADRTDTVYLDIWEREVDGDEDENLVNQDIDLPTCVRLKREWVVRVEEGTVAPPIPTTGHVFFPLARLQRQANVGIITSQQITDIRKFCLKLSSLSAEIVSARGNQTNLSDRLNEFDSAISSLRGEIVSARGDKTNLSDRLSDIENRIARLEKFHPYLYGHSGAIGGRLI